MKRRAGALLLVMGMLALGACGDDDDDPAVADDTEDASEDGDSTDGGTDAEGDETAAGGWCEGYIELTAGDPEPAQIREVAGDAPDEAAAALEILADGFEADPEGYFESPEFSEQLAIVGGAANEDCTDQVIEVTAADYSFEGIPNEIDAGVIGVDFANEGAEFHEILVMRKADGVTETWDEILQLEEEEAGPFIVEVGGGFAAPGESSTAILDLSTPGEYVAVCFVPVGATPEANEEEVDGPPHMTQGMKVEFTVS